MLAGSGPPSSHACVSGGQGDKGVCFSLIRTPTSTSLSLYCSTALLSIILTSFLLPTPVVKPFLPFSLFCTSFWHLSVSVFASCITWHEDTFSACRPILTDLACKKCSALKSKVLWIAISQYCYKCRHTIAVSVLALMIKTEMVKSTCRFKKDSRKIILEQEFYSQKSFPTEINDLSSQQQALRVAARRFSCGQQLADDGGLMECAVKISVVTSDFNSKLRSCWSKGPENSFDTQAVWAEF